MFLGLISLNDSSKAWVKVPYHNQIHIAWMVEGIISQA